MIRAEVICDSVSPQGVRLTTIKCRYPWFIHGEVMTHRVFSRNASSNRAIPLAKMLEEARSDELRAEPVYWGAEQRGMEPGGELTGTALIAARHAWRMAAHDAADRAEAMAAGTHKSLCNRLLMPFTHANVVITATEWDNFFGLRLDRAADPTMRALAEAMWRCWNESKPRTTDPGQWHMPFIEKYDSMSIDTYKQDADDLRAHKRAGADVQELMLKVSVARCARVSYETFETGKRSTVEADLALYDRLAAQGHWSPFEHQATPDTRADVRWYKSDGKEWPQQLSWSHPSEHGNLRGFRQYRKMMAGEAVRPLPEPYHARRAQTDRKWRTP